MILLAKASSNFTDQPIVNQFSLEASEFGSKASPELSAEVGSLASGDLAAEGSAG
jgi:hypothetical protein